MYQDRTSPYHHDYSQHSGRPSYGSQQRYGYVQTHYRQDQYSARHSAAPGAGRVGGGGGYGPGGGGRYSGQGGVGGGGYGYYRDERDGSYRSGSRGRTNGVSYGRGGRGQPCPPPFPDLHSHSGAGAGGSDHTRPRRNSHNAGDSDFYSARDYTGSSSPHPPQPQQPVQMNKDHDGNNNPGFSDTSSRGLGSTRGRGRGGRGGRGRGVSGHGGSRGRGMAEGGGTRGRGEPGGRGAAPRGRGRGRGGAAARGRGRGGRFSGRGSFKFDYNDKEFGCAAELKSLPTSEFAIKDLRQILKDKGLHRNLNIVSLEDGVAKIKAMEKFEEVKEKLTNVVIGENMVEIEELDMESLPKPQVQARSKSPSARSNKDSPKQSGRLFRVEMSCHSVADSNVPDLKMISAALTKVGLASPKSLGESKEPNVVFFKVTLDENLKELKMKLQSLRIGQTEVMSVAIKKSSKSKCIDALLKLQPVSGHLKLDNIPEDCNAQRLKEKIKKKLNYSIGVQSCEGGKAEVFYKPKVGTILERMAGLTIGENEIVVREVEDSDETFEDEVEVAKIQCPKTLNGKKLASFFKNLAPSELQFKSNSILIQFNAKPKILKSLKEQVENLEKEKVVEKKKPGKKSWAEEKEQEEEERAMEQEEEGKAKEEEVEKCEVPAVFGSTDVRERIKEKGN